VNQYFNAILTIIGLVFCTGLMAENMNDYEYTAAEKSNISEHNSATINCEAVVDIDKGICIEVAKSRKIAAEAKLTAAPPSNEANYNLSIAKGNAEYEFALQKCKSNTISTRENCKKIARETWQHSQSDANTRLKMMRAIEQNDTRVIDNHPKSYKNDN
jgi:hypothetical protein